MKVVFLESIEGTAIVGDVKVVKNGFARNYLLPQGLAAPAKEPHLTRAKAGAEREAIKQMALDKNASMIAEKLEGKKISMIAKVGEQGKLYGSITSIHIADEVAKLLGEGAEFDHRKVLLPEAIKEIGTQPVRLRLTRNVEAAIEVEVISEEPDEDEIPIDPDADTEADEATGGQATGDEETESDEATAELNSDDESDVEEAEEKAEEPKAEVDDESAEDTADAETTEDTAEE